LPWLRPRAASSTMPITTAETTPSTVERAHRRWPTPSAQCQSAPCLIAKNTRIGSGFCSRFAEGPPTHAPARMSEHWRGWTAPSGVPNRRPLVSASGECGPCPGTCAT
jgi:hypothetical protein